MLFKGMKNLLVASGLFVGLASSSALFAQVSLKCAPVSVSDPSIKEDQQVVLDGKRKKRDVYTFVVTQTCDVKGINKKTDLSVLSQAYHQTLKSYDMPFSSRSKKMGNEKFEIKTQVGGSYELVHTRPTDKTGIMTLSSSMSVGMEGAKGFQTHYSAPNPPSKVKKQGFGTNDRAKFTKSVKESTHLSTSTMGGTVTFKRVVTIVKPKIATHEVFIGPAKAGVSKDLASLVNFHKTVYNKAF